MTIFLSSHEVREIRALCQNLAVIESGKIVYRGPPSSLGKNEDELEDSLVKLLRPEGPEAPAGFMRPEATIRNR